MIIELTEDEALYLKYYLAHSFDADYDGNVYNPVGIEMFAGNENSKKACDMRAIVIDKIDKEEKHGSQSKRQD